MSLICTSQPSVEPVEIDDLKDFLRLDAGDTSNDALLESLVLAARQWAEVYCQRRFITQTWKLGIDFFPGYIDLKLAGQKVSSPFVSGSNAILVGIRYAIVLPYPPVQSISAFTYLNANGQTTTMTENTDFTADLDSQPARLTPPFGAMWPVARVVTNAVSIEYVCGYGDSADDVPEGVKTAIKLLVAEWFENRVPDNTNIPMAVKAVLGPYRDLRF